MPSEATVRGWALIDAGPGFALQYRTAREIGLEREADEIKDLADNCRKGEVVTRTEVRRTCSKCARDLKWFSRWKHADDDSDMCARAKAVKICEEKVVTSDMIERSKLQINVRMWRLERMLPRKFSNAAILRQDTSGPQNGLITYEQLEILVRARRATIQIEGDA